ncbi:MAG: hypothetical protein OEN21_18725 [Myxococcales bacterium]|nr:hypothetical protein [Myxococcales bacterium]
MFARLFALLILAPSLGILGCGDDEPVPIGNTEVRIFVEEGLVQQVEYYADCQDPDERTYLPEFYEPEQGNLEVWIVYVNFPPGPCTILLRGRDRDGMVICSTEQSFAVDGTLTEVDIILDCDTSPETAMRSD